MDKKEVEKYEGFSEYKRLSQTKEDKLLKWLEGEKGKEHDITEKQKREFINQIRGDIGKQIKESKNNQPKKIKISLFKRFLKIISKMFDIIG